MRFFSFKTITFRTFITRYPMASRLHGMQSDMHLHLHYDGGDKFIDLQDVTCITSNFINKTVLKT